MQLAFWKMHGLGNDFVVVDGLDGDVELSPGQVRWICDRHFGVGADGLMVVAPPTTPDAHYRMRYFNADGSVAEMCGNGARCFVKYVVDNGLVPSEASSIAIETLAGVKRATFTRDEAGLLDAATVDMGSPVLKPSEIPADFESDLVYDHPLDTPAGVVLLTAVGLGNPHVVIWTDDVDSAPVGTVGPFIEHHPRFPKGTNVEFAELVSSESVRMRVWERGVGETLACGTGACAVAVAGSVSCRTGRQVAIALPGGRLDVRWDDDGHVYLTGPAAAPFTGVADVPET